MNVLPILLLLLTGSSILSRSVTTGSITTAKIADGAVTSAKLGLTTPIQYSQATGITAHSGGGQASATALTAEFNRVDTVAAQLDSVLLPAPSSGFMRMTVYNAGAKALAVYPQSGHTIGSRSANALEIIPPGSQRTFFTRTTSNWGMEPWVRHNIAVETLDFDDFDESEVAPTVSVGLGKLALVTAISGGTRAAITATAAAAHPGIVTLGTSTSSTGSSGLGFHSSATVFGGAYHDLEWDVQFPTLGTAGEQYAAVIGFGDSYGAEPNNGAYFRYANGVNGDVWEISSASGGSRTKKTTGSIAVAGATYYRLRVVIDPAGTRADFFVGDTYVDSITTNLPTAGCAPLVNIVKSNGSTARSLIADYVSYHKRLTTTR